LDIHNRDLKQTGEAMNNIVEVAKNAQSIISEYPPPCCLLCGEKLFSPFDKLYLATYGKCIDCTDEVDELQKNSKNIFAIIEA